MSGTLVTNPTIIGSDHDLSPGRRQAIIWTNAGILLIRPVGTKFSEIFIEIYTFSFKKILLKVWYGKCWPFCLCLNELRSPAPTLTFFIWNLMVARTSSTLDTMDSLWVNMVGNLPALFRPGPRIRGIVLMMVSEARKASYSLAEIHEHIQ